MPSSVKSVASNNSSEDGILVNGGIGIDVDKMGFPGDYGDMIAQAIADPAILTPEQLEELSRTICAKAFEKSIYSYPISSILITICDKDKSQVFTQTLITCCRQWFNYKYTKLRPSEGPNPSPRKHRWPAFCAFATDFYLNLKCKLRGVKLTLDDDDNEDAESGDNNSDGEVQSDEVHFEFADLLFDTCLDIISILDTTNSPTTEIECLLNILRSVGKHMEKDRPERMSELIDELKVAFVGPVSTRLPDNCVKSILELIEWAASGWQFNTSQVAYYYPSLS